MRLAVVEVAVGREQHLRANLAEAIEHGVDAEVRRARRPHGADAGRRQHRDDGLGTVRDECRDAVAVADAERAQARGDARDLRAQLVPRQLAALAALVGEYERRAARVVLEQVLGEVEPRAFEPLGARAFACRRAARCRTAARRGCRRTAKRRPRTPRATRCSSRTAPRSRRRATVRDWPR